MVESNFIVHFNFVFFGFILVVAEVAWKLRFLNGYGELDTVEPGGWEKSLGK